MPCIQSVDSTGASSFLRMLLLVRASSHALKIFTQSHTQTHIRARVFIIGHTITLSAYRTYNLANDNGRSL